MIGCTTSSSIEVIFHLLAHVRVEACTFSCPEHTFDGFPVQKAKVNIVTQNAAVSRLCQNTRAMSSDSQISPTFQEDTAARARQSHIKDNLQLIIKLHPPYFAQQSTYQHGRCTILEKVLEHYHTERHHPAGHFSIAETPQRINFISAQTK